MDPTPLAMIRACVYYNNVSRKLILAFKHGDGLQLTPFLTSLMATNFAIMTNGEDSLVVPVPLHRLRYFRRRYNQSAELRGGSTTLPRAAALPPTFSPGTGPRQAGAG